MRIGMGCKAQTAAIAVAMARICNAADRPSPRPHARAEIVNTFLWLAHDLLNNGPMEMDCKQVLGNLPQFSMTASHAKLRLGITFGV